MPLLWIRDDSRSWTEFQLSESPVDLTQWPPVRLAGDGPAGPDETAVLLMSASLETNAEGWVLIWGPHREVSINGLPVQVGMRLLADGDEIVLESGETMFFSAESPARVEPFPGGAQEVQCPRCKSIVEPDTPSVRCPRCGIWYHQKENSNCWTYAPHCGLCSASTDLDAGYQWTPADL